MHVSSEFTNLDSEPGQSLSKFPGYLGCKSFHWSHIDDLEVFAQHRKFFSLWLIRRVRHNVLADCIQDREHRCISFTLFTILVLNNLSTWNLSLTAPVGAQISMFSLVP